MGTYGNPNSLYLRNLRNKLKKHSVTKNCSDLSQILLKLKISKILQILGLQPRISKVFLNQKSIFFSQQIRTILVTKYYSWGTCYLSIALFEVLLRPPFDTKDPLDVCSAVQGLGLDLGLPIYGHRSDRRKDLKTALLKVSSWINVPLRM